MFNSNYFCRGPRLRTTHHHGSPQMHRNNQTRLQNTTGSLNESTWHQNHCCCMQVTTHLHACMTTDLQKSLYKVPRQTWKTTYHTSTPPQLTRKKHAPHPVCSSYCPLPTRKSSQISSPSFPPSSELRSQDAAVEFLLKMGAKVNVAHRGVRFSVYGTPLSQAARGKSVKMVQSLLNAKAAVDINCGGGKTPLFWAAKESRLHPNVSSDIIQVLLEAGADVTKKDQFGNTVLFQVIGNHYKKGSVEVAQKLLEAKADVNAMNNDGQTAVYAAALHDSDMRKFLEKDGSRF